MSVPVILAHLLPLVVVFGILAVAIYEHVSSVALSLPIAPTLTAVTIALPLIAVANAVYLRLGRRVAARHQLRNSSADRRLLLWTAVPLGRRLRLPGLPVVLQVLQGIVTVATAAILIVNSISGGGGGGGGSSPSSPILRCALESTWQQLYSAHDANALRRIQDTLNCCGFNSVADRAWPFPHGSNPGGPGGSPGATTCAVSYGRTTACRGLWMQTAQRRAGVELAVVGLVAVFQVLTLLLRDGPPLDGAAYADADDVAVGARRPLLEDGPRPVVQAYADEENDADDEALGNNANGSGGRVTETNGTTTTDDGPRLEPSSLHNAWAAE